MTPTLTDADVEKYVREIAQQEAAKATGTKTEETKEIPSSSLTLNIAGKEMTFKDATEASAVLTSVYEQQSRPQPTPGKTVTSDTDNGWTPEDQEKYVAMLVKNPMQAQEYIDEKRFGVKNPTEVWKQNMQTVQSMATQMTIDQFVASHKDYHVSPENAQAMQNVLSELGGGRPVINPMALEAAYAIADKRGLFKKPADTSKESPYNPYLAGPPAAGRTSSQASPNFEADAESMTADQIEAYLSRFNR